MKNRGLSVALIAIATAILGLSVADAQPPGGRGRGGGFGLVQFLIKSEAFDDGGIVPQKYAGREGVQPGFSFSGLPDTVTSVAIIFHDLDVPIQNGTGDVLHWMAWNIPASAGGIPEGSLPAGSVTGTNLMGQAAYMGPGAPAGERYHHYVFEFYGLSQNLDLPASASRADLLAAMEGKVLAKAAYVGRYHSPAAQ
jgi:hypothetical protein